MKHLATQGKENNSRSITEFYTGYDDEVEIDLKLDQIYYRDDMYGHMRQGEKREACVVVLSTDRLC